MTMDTLALTQLTGASQGPAGVAALPVDTRSLLTEIAAATTLSDVEKTSLISAVAQVDSQLSGAIRSSIMQQVQGLGVYLRNSGSEGFPRWPMMTALRAYGLNLTDGGQNTQVVVKALQSHLEQIAQGRGVPLEKAIAAASAPVRQYVAPAPAPEVPAAEPKTVDTLA